MSKKIILFMSPLKDGKSESEYHGPNGKIYTGTQTNEAPVKYLLDVHPDTSEILCIVTRQAQETGWNHFNNTIHTLYPDLDIISFPFEEGQNFRSDLLPRILSEITPRTRNQPGDEILLETTGGFRNAVMHLTLLSRVLSYTGAKTVQAVYSNNNSSPPRIEDITDMLDLFDLLSGMQELTSLGSVRTLRQYYNRQFELNGAQDEKIENLLSAMEKLTESINLCRTPQIQKRMTDFTSALTEAESCSDVLMQKLLAAFRNKFGNKLTTPNLIRWCVESGMIQQALTVYTERIPGYLLRDRKNEYLCIPENVSVDFQDYEDRYAKLFMDNFLMLSAGPLSPQPAGNIGNAPTDDTLLVASFKTLIKQMTSGAEPTVPDSLREGKENLDIILRYAFQNGKYPPKWSSKLPPAKYSLKPLEDILLRMTHPKTQEGFLNSIANNEVFLSHILGIIPDEATGKKRRTARNYRAETIERMEEFLPGSGYALRIPLEQMKTIARDYLYIKAIRNMTNHANDTENEAQIELMEYLTPYGYQSLKKLTSRDVESVLFQSLANLKIPYKKGDDPL